MIISSFSIWYSQRRLCCKVNTRHIQFYESITRHGDDDDDDDDNDNYNNDD